MREMTPRQRVRTALSREVPDRVPKDISWGLSPRVQKIFEEKTGAKDPLDYFGVEVRGVDMNHPARPDTSHYYRDASLPEGTTYSIWGVAHIPGESDEAYHFTHLTSPLRKAKTLEEIADYPLPNYADERCYRGLKDRVEAIHRANLASAAPLAQTLFETAWAIRGIEEFLEDMMVRPDFADCLLDRLKEMRLIQARHYAESSVDIAWLGDDVGSQKGMMISPKVWRRFLKPRMADIIREIKRISPKTFIFYHCDGDCREIIPELIEIGVEILNPIQPECMDPAELKLQYGDRLAFWGTIGIQTVLPFGTPDDVREMVKERVATVGRGGGLLLGPTHVIEPEVPWENIVALYQAIDEYGQYDW
ncbi:MAG: uroporphyrinogen decarboxylase family protein [bacterium]